MSKYPTTSTDDTAASEPLIPKASEPKDYEAAVGALMSSYGFSGGVQAKPVQTDTKKKKKNAKGKSKKKAGRGDNQSGQASAPSSSNTRAK